MDIAPDELRAAGMEAQFETVEGAIAEHRAGESTNVAVVSEPFGGREALLDHAEERLDDVQRITLSGVTASQANLTFDEDADVVIVENCHYLYTRQIGGFDPLDAFLERIAMSEPLFLTSWNQYAWDYLTAVRDVDATFPVAVRLPLLSSAELTTLLKTLYGPDLPEFVETSQGGRVKTVTFDRAEIPLPGDRAMGLPVPELNTEYLTSRSNAAADDTQAVVFEKVAQLSAGNPGVATSLWERSVRNDQIAPAYVTEIDEGLDIDEEEAFLLEVILAKETVTRSALSNVLDIPVDRALQTLSEQSVLAVDGDVVTLVPERVHTAVDHLKGRRWMW